MLFESLSILCVYNNSRISFYTLILAFRFLHRSHFVLPIIEEGIFRNDINFAIINQAMSMQMEMLIYSDITENYPISEIYSEVTFLHMRGITTPKGMQMVDAFLQSVKEKP